MPNKNNKTACKSLSIACLYKGKLCTACYLGWGIIQKVDKVGNETYSVDYCVAFADDFYNFLYEYRV